MRTPVALTLPRMQVSILTFYTKPSWRGGKRRPVAARVNGSAQSHQGRFPPRGTLRALRMTADPFAHGATRLDLAPDFHAVRARQPNGFAPGRRTRRTLCKVKAATVRRKKECLCETASAKAQGNHI
jgi:hypothetical protein